VLLPNSKSFANAQVLARQPLSPSSVVDHFPASDADLPLGPICFTGIVSLTLPQPHSLGVSMQAPSAWERFSDILNSRKPSEWGTVPSIDTDSLIELIGPNTTETFPIVHSHKVNLSKRNVSLPYHERRELLLYRLVAPLPIDEPGVCGANAHPLVHAYQCDRNGLLMLANHLRYDVFRAGSMSYSFVLHVNADETRMEFGEDQWWIHEWSFKRVGAGRGQIEAQVWSPEGLHVATMYQDGMLLMRDEAMMAREIKAALGSKI
jgi:hypothetical protein